MSLINDIGDAMEHLVFAIRKSLDDSNWYGAIALSLMLPDVCASVEFPSMNPGKRYKDFYSKYLENIEIGGLDRSLGSFISKEVCLALRNAFLHSAKANFNNPDANLKGLIFVVSQGQVRFSKINDVLQVDVVEFCEFFCAGCLKWISENKILIDYSNVLDIKVVEIGDRVNIGSGADGFQIIKPDGTEEWGLLYEARVKVGNLYSDEDFNSNDNIRNLVEEIKLCMLAHDISLLYPINSDFCLGFNESFDFYAVNMGKDTKFNAEIASLINEVASRREGKLKLDQSELISSLRLELKEIFLKYGLLQIRAFNKQAILGWDIRNEDSNIGFQISELEWISINGI